MKLFKKNIVFYFIVLQISILSIAMEKPQYTSSEPTTQNIETLWADVKKRIAVNKELKSHFARQQPVIAVIAPMPSNITTQSWAQLKYVFGPGKTEAEYINEGLNSDFSFPYKALIRILNVQYQTLVRQILEREKNNWGYYVFYHGQHGALTLINDLMQSLYGWLNIEIPDEQVKFLRLFIKREPEYRNVTEFLQATRSLKPTGNIMVWDHIPVVQKNLLSTNIGLFGNSFNEDESTWYYFVAGKSINPPNLQEQMATFFTLFGFNQKFLEPILQAHKVYIEQSTQKFQYPKSTKIARMAPGNLYQIFIHPSVVEELVYLSEIGGVPFTYECTALYPPQDQKQATDYLQECKDSNHLQQQVFNSNLGRLSINRFMTLLRTSQIPMSLYITIDEIQARILLKYSTLIDPTKVKIYKYNSPHINPELTNIAEKIYKQKLNEIMEGIIKEWLFRKTLKTGEKTRLELFFEFLKNR